MTNAPASVRPPGCIVGSCPYLGKFYRRVTAQEISILVRVCRSHAPVPAAVNSCPAARSAASRTEPIHIVGTNECQLGP
jgi:hypothetical protein